MALLADSDRLCWEAFARAAPQASAYHQLGWKDVIERSFGHRTFYLLSRDEANAIDGILPLVQLRSVLFGNFLVSLPYVNYGGACATSRESLDRLLAEARGIAAETLVRLPLWVGLEDSSGARHPAGDRRGGGAVKAEWRAAG
jgi:hypothetical protein